jgi:hypothetical protein
MPINRAQVVLFILSLLMVSVLVACGGGDDDDDDSGSASTPAATERSGDDGGDDSGDTGDDGDDGEIDFGDGLVVVTIGDDRFEFDMDEGFNVCRDVFGGLQFGGAGTDGRDTTVSGWIPPADWESYDDNRYDAPSIELDVKETNSQWLADEERAEERGYAPGTSQVDSFEIDGLQASGTATFIDSFAIGETEPVQGTFEVSCTE